MPNYYSCIAPRSVGFRSLGDSPPLPVTTRPQHPLIPDIAAKTKTKKKPPLISLEADDFFVSLVGQDGPGQNHYDDDEEEEEEAEEA